MDFFMVNSFRPYYNLSPQGDGNTLIDIMILLFLITTYPRKGTETYFRI